jgi:hypothetical protein
VATGLVVPLILTAAALASKPTAGASYTGKTRQGRAISFDVSSNGRRVIHPTVDLKTTCFGGGHSYAKTSTHNTATASGRVRKGKFALVFSEGASFKGGVTAKASFVVSGRFTSAKRAAGTASVTVRYSTGAVCKSGAVHFAAHA